MSEDHLPLAGEFPAPTEEQWRAAVDRVLAKGDVDRSAPAAQARFDKALASTTPDGIPIAPLYLRRDVMVAPDRPGVAPFLRGATPAVSTQHGWELRQPLELVDGQVVSAASALHQLEDGASALLLRTPREVAAQGPISVEQLDAALEGVLLELITVALDPSLSTVATNALLDLYGRRGHNLSSVRAVLGHDPVAAFAANLEVEALEGARAAATAAAGRVHEMPGIITMVADGLIFHEAGASDAEELGATTAVGIAHLRLLVEAGLSLEAAFSQIEFRFATTADQFSTIAKLRAARRLWSQVARTCGVTLSRGQRQHVLSSPAMLTSYDPSVNLLRNTVACFGAGVGGADAVTIEPHDQLVMSKGGSALGVRMARNTQHVLLEESHLARIGDPAGGSYYVEHLTEQLAARAWALVGAIEAEGDVVAALSSSMLIDQIEATWDARVQRMATRRQVITGVSDFPNVADVVEVLPLRPERAGLARRRYAEPFEHLRHEVVAMGSSAPGIVLVRLGSQADSTARATYAINFFETGGFVVHTLEATGSLEELGDQAARTGASIACLCGTDAHYGTEGPSVVQALKASGLRTVVAGNPKVLSTSFEGAAPERYIYTGCDVLGTLRSFLHAGEVA